MTNPIKPTQAARDAAADYYQSRSHEGHTFNAMRTGECDNHPLVQAFAAHELAAEARIGTWLREDARDCGYIDGAIRIEVADDIERGDWKDADND